MTMPNFICAVYPERSEGSPVHQRCTRLEDAPEILRPLRVLRMNQPATSMHDGRSRHFIDCKISALVGDDESVRIAIVCDGVGVDSVERCRRDTAARSLERDAG